MHNRTHVLDYETRFREAVIDDFADAYVRGETPIPCVRCNQTVKFRDLAAKARELGADALATGHYVRRREQNGRVELHAGAAADRDQSYFLFATTGAQLDLLRFPLGHMTKEEVRGHARRFGLAIADKPDSQDICFIPDGDYRQFVGPRLEMAKPGLLIGPDGEVLSKHDGVHNFTIGQRKGLGLNGGGQRPLFVCEIDAESGTVVLGHAESLLRSELFASNPTWVSGEPPPPGTRISAKIRYKSPEAAATVWPADDHLRIDFETPQRAITPGQAVVFFDGDEVLGGATIELPRVASPQPLEIEPTAIA